jgi:hypothetical protein
MPRPATVLAAVAMPTLAAPTLVARYEKTFPTNGRPKSHPFPTGRHATRRSAKGRVYDRHLHLTPGDRHDMDTTSRLRKLRPGHPELWSSGPG